MKILNESAFQESYRSRFGTDEVVDEITVSFVEVFVAWSRLNCSNDEKSQSDWSLFPTAIDEPLTAISWGRVILFVGRRVILEPHETK